MNKFYGEVGYVFAEKTGTSDWEENVVPKYYYGDILQISKRYQGSDKMNDDIEVTNQISILADPYAYRNFQFIKYVEWLGTKWKVSSVSVEYPRLVLSIGGVYNAPDAE